MPRSKRRRGQRCILPIRMVKEEGSFVLDSVAKQKLTRTGYRQEEVSAPTAWRVLCCRGKNVHGYR